MAVKVGRKGIRRERFCYFVVLKKMSEVTVRTREREGKGKTQLFPFFSFFNGDAKSGCEGGKKRIRRERFSYSVVFLMETEEMAVRMREREGKRKGCYFLFSLGCYFVVISFCLRKT